MHDDLSTHSTEPSTTRRPAGPRWSAPIALLAGVLLSTQGCQSNYENHDWVNWSDLNFGGYAEHPLATIQIQAFDQSTNTWRVVTTAQASNSPTHFGGRTLYLWTRPNFDFTTVPNWTCYWGNNGYCTIPTGAAYAQFRFREVGSQMSYMTTFDSGGVMCVINKVLHEDMDWFAAGVLCASDESPVLTLRQLT